MLIFSVIGKPRAFLPGICTCSGSRITIRVGSWCLGVPPEGGLSRAEHLVWAVQKYQIEIANRKRGARIALLAEIQDSS